MWKGKNPTELVLPPISLRKILNFNLQHTLNAETSNQRICLPDLTDHTSGKRKNDPIKEGGTESRTDSVTMSDANSGVVFENGADNGAKVSSSGNPWVNQVVHGDSLFGMHALLLQGWRGQIQMIYMDPPYGIDFNAQMIKDHTKAEGYIDSWEYGLGSYLAHLRERFLVMKDLLHPTGSLFVQIGQQNLHYVRCILDEIFGKENCVNLITYRTAISTNNVTNIADHILWYARDKSQVFSRQLFTSRPRSKVAKTFTYQEADPESGESILFKPQELVNRLKGGKTRRDPRLFPIQFQSKTFYPPQGFEWRWDLEAIQRLIDLDRVTEINGKLYGKRYQEDFPHMILTNVWTDTSTSTFAAKKHYSVHTNPKVIHRCMAMTTRAGDIVLDPTSGSGTTAYVAEKYNRRWVVFDTSAVAIQSTITWLTGSVYDTFRFSPDANASDHEYKSFTKISLSNLANNRSSPQEALYDTPLHISKASRLVSPFYLSILSSECPEMGWDAHEIHHFIDTHGFIASDGSTTQFSEIQSVGSLKDILPQTSYQIEDIASNSFLFRVTNSTERSLIICIHPYVEIQEIILGKIIHEMEEIREITCLYLIVGQFQLSFGFLQQLHAIVSKSTKDLAHIQIVYCHQDLMMNHLNHDAHLEAFCLSEWVDSQPKNGDVSSLNLSLFKTNASPPNLPFSPQAEKNAHLWLLFPKNLGDQYNARDPRIPWCLQLPKYKKYLPKKITALFGHSLLSKALWKGIFENAPEGLNVEFHLCVLDMRGILHYAYLIF